MEHNNFVKRAKTNLEILPVDLKITAMISIICYSFTLFHRIFLPKTIYEEIIPYTGWSPGGEYGFIPIFILIGLLSTVNDKFRRHIRISRVLIIGTFLLHLSSGIFDWLEEAPEMYNDPNPYLRYAPLRPIYSILIPIIWISINSMMLLRERKLK